MYLYLSYFYKEYLFLRVATHSGNFQIVENLGEFWLVFLTHGNFDFFWKSQGSYKIKKNLREIFPRSKLKFT